MMMGALEEHCEVMLTLEVHCEVMLALEVMLTLAPLKLEETSTLVMLRVERVDR